MSMNKLFSIVPRAFPVINKIQILGRGCQTKIVTDGEIFTVLQKNFPNSKISVEDVSGGCGAMFNIYIESSAFKGLSIVKQHRTVYDLLKEQISKIHGLHLVTKAAP